jgi:FkbM family methyltransferase
VADERVKYSFWAELTAAQARNTGFHETRVKRRFKRAFRTICRLVDPTVTVEVGAHEASFSAWVAATFPDARCLALEANPVVYARHRERLRSCGVDYRHLAAAAHTGQVTLHVPGVLAGGAKGPGNKMGSLSLHRHDVVHDSVEVPAGRVDDLLTLREQDRVVAWIDVEGASERFLEGARDVLARAAVIQIEVENEEVWPGQWLDTEVNRYLDSIGKIPVMRDVQRPHQYNVLYLDEDLCERSDVIECLAEVMGVRRAVRDIEKVPLTPASPRRAWRRLRYPRN